MNTRKVDLERLKQAIEETRRKLNKLLDSKNVVSTEEIVAASQQINILIKTYYDKVE